MLRIGPEFLDSDAVDALDIGAVPGCAVNAAGREFSELLSVTARLSACRSVPPGCARPGRRGVVRHTLLIAQVQVQDGSGTPCRECLAAGSA